MGGKPRSRAAELSAANIQAALTESIVHAIPGGIVHVNADGSIQTANPQALKILGLSYDELTRRYTVDFEPETIHEDGSPCLASDYPVTRALLTGEPQPPTTIGVRRPDGVTSWAVFTAVPVKDPTTEQTLGAVVTFLDVTELRRASDALRASEATLTAVVNNAPCYIATTDTNARVTYLNRSPFPNVAVGEILETSVFDWLRPAHHELVQTHLDHAIRDRRIGSFELPLDVGDKVHVFSVTVGPVVVEDEVRGVSLIGTDVTEIRDLQSRVIVSDRLASLGTLAAGVAHEVNNPLTYVQMHLHRMAATLAGDVDANARDSLLGDVEVVREGALRIERIVRDLSAVSPLPQRGVEPVSITEVLDPAIRMAEHEISCRAQLVCDPEADLPPLSGDPVLLSQIILNLLINAAHAIQEGDVANNVIRVRASRDREYVRISVTDTGTGIPDELRARVVEPFVTTKDVGQGSGLGLYVSHRIIESLGGRLEISSRVGEGTEVSVWVPIAGEAVERPVTALESKVASTRLRVLVVDDERAIRELIRAELVGHDTTLAASGREAIECLTRDDYDLVFCDLIMPDLTGMDVFEFACKAKPRLAETMVFLTGGAFTPRARQFANSVPNPVLYKPFSVADLHDCVAGASSRRRGAITAERGGERLEEEVSR